MLAVVLSAFDLGAADPRPNILFIMSDDHAAQSMSCYGSRLNQTPQMDRLASQGMRFTHCFAINSICTPSRAAILTGKYHHRNGVPVFNRFDGRQDNVAKRLKAAGYQTGMIGKWHLFSDPTGFDYWNILPGQGDYHNPVMIENGRTNKYTGYVTDLITDFSIDFLKKRDPDRPFLLMTHHKATHRNWQPDSRHAAMYENVKIPEPATIDDDYAGRSPAAAEATMRLDRNLSTNDLKGPIDARLTPSEKRHSNYQRYLKDYLRCLASMDDNVGRLLDYLDQSGLATNTLVIYTSDQGFFLGEHGWYDKRFMYEESLRMPLLARLPGRIAPSSVNTNMVLNVDFAPTFLELAGLKVPAEIQGRSLVPVLEGVTPRDWRQSMYYRYYHYPGDHNVQPHYGVRTREHKLIYFENLDAWELYDLQLDPNEMRNVAGDPAYGGVRRKLVRELERLRQQLGDEVVHSASLRGFMGGGRFFAPTNSRSIRLQGPFGIQFDAQGEGVIVEMTGNRVLRMKTNGWVSVMAGDGVQGDGGDGGPGEKARLNGPHALALTPEGDVLVADTWNHRVRRIERASGIIRTIAGTGRAGFSGDGGPAVNADLNGVYGIALDYPGENLYLTDLENRRVRVVNLKSGLIRTVAGNSERGVPTDGALAIQSPLVDPRSVTVDRQGRVYILERSGNALRIVERSGRIRTVVGVDGKPGLEGDGGPGTTARLRGPKDLCMDQDDSVLIADTENHVVRRYDPRTGLIHRIAGTGLAGREGMDGPGEVCELNQPHGVWVHPTGDVYISDSSNHRILRLVRRYGADRQTASARTGR